MHRSFPLNTKVSLTLADFLLYLPTQQESLTVIGFSKILSDEPLPSDTLGLCESYLEKYEFAENGSGNGVVRGLVQRFEGIVKGRVKTRVEAMEIQGQSKYGK